MVIKEFSEEELDYLKEIINIAAGNAAGALEQILGKNIDMRMVELNILSSPDESAFTQAPASQVCVKMRMSGEVVGDIYFIVPDRKMLKNICSIVCAGYETPAEEISVLSEIGTIITGVYLMAIHDFTTLRIYHSVPEESKLDLPSFFLVDKEVQNILVIRNEFVVKEERIETIFIMIPTMKSTRRLVDSMEQAMEVLRGGK